MEMTGCSLEGVHPSPPAAVNAMPNDMKKNWVNLTE